MKKTVHVLLAAAALAILPSCVSVKSPALNLPMNPARPERSAASAPALGDGAGVIVLFSGGGARSAAFGYGVLDRLRRTATGKGHDLAEAVDVVGGVSGGGVLAAYAALYGPDRIDGFRRDFLLADPEESMSMRLSPANLIRGYRGGINDVTGFPAWLDRHLFRGARLGDLPARPRLLLHATDLYNRMPFAFDRPSFAAICSDHARYPLALAVGASAAVPVAFAPVVLRNYSAGCPVPPAAKEAAAPLREGLFEREFDRSEARLRQSSDIRYLKLYDGGLVDGTGVQGLTLSLARPAPEPLTPARAREIRHLLVLVVDASTRWGGSLSETEALPKAPETLVAAVDAMINIPNLQGVDGLRTALPRWQAGLRRFRCGAVASLDCRGPSVDLARIALSDIEDPALLKRILGLHNRFTLKPEEVDFLGGLGDRLLTANPDYRRFLARLKGKGPLAAPHPGPKSPA